MAQNAELLLKVGLDLSHFRQQLTTIGSQLAGQPLSINIKFDRQKIVSEFRLLDRYVRNKKFYVEINTNLKTEVDRAVQLTGLLKNMPRGGGPAKTPGVVEAGFSQAQLKKLKQDIKPLYKAAADAGLIAFDEAIAKNNTRIARELSQVGKSSIIGLLNGLSSGDAQVRAAAQNLGNALISTIKATLGIASPSKETGKLGKFAAQGFEQGFMSGIVKAERSMARAIRSSLMNAIREGFGNLPGMGGALVSFERQLAASVQLAVRKAVRDGMRAAIAPGAKGGLLGGTGGAATGAAVGGAKALGAGVAGGVAKLTAGGVLGTAANLARYSLDSSAYQEFVVKLYQEIIHAALSTGSQGAIIGALAVGGVAGSLGFARGASGSLVLQAATAIRNRILAALLAVSTGDLNNIVKVMVRDVTGLVFQQQIRQLRAATAQLPAINWPAIAPAKTAPSIGPSSSGKLLTGAAPMAAIGAAQAPAGLLPAVSQTTARRESVSSGLQAIFDAGGPVFPEGPSGQLALTAKALQARIDAILADYFKVVEVTIKEIFDPQDLKRALNIFSYLPQVLRDAEARTRQARVGIPGAMGIAGLLPAGKGRAPSPYSTGGESREQMMARRTAEAYARSAVRGMDIMGGGAGRPPSPYSYAYRSARPTNAIVPYAPGGAMVPSGGGGGAGGGPGGGRRGGRGGGGMFGELPNISLPGSGAIRELGQEFAFATKQVLLFGQAYKLLAFIQSFPDQVGQAVGQLQSFRNTLAAISPNAREVAASNDLILQLVEQYNIPLQSARDGFTKLYASMQPAGFSGDQVRELFTGVSKAAATFGMSSDKIDRVNYAFAQMASKGQVMSEELKGQLGDVLPGAMAIFAQAAGFTGPEAISKFSAALEDGRYKGTAMMELLNNVSIVLNQKFSAGAEGAASTFQGAINNMQTSMKSLYESFEPIAVIFLNGVVTPIMNGVKIATDGLNAFFSGAQAQTAGGFALAQALEQLRPSFEGIRQNAVQIVEVFSQLIKAALGVAQILLQIAGNPVVGYLAKVYLNVLILTTAIQLLNLRALIPMIANLARSVVALIGFTAQCVRVGQSAQVMGLMVQTAGITLRTFFASTGVGLIVVGISLLIERFMTMNQALADTKAKALGAAQAIRTMSATEARHAESQAARDIKLLQQLSQQKQVGGVFGRKFLITSAEQKAALGRAGVSTTRLMTGKSGEDGAKIEDLAGAIQARQGVMREAEYQRRLVSFEEQQAAKPLAFAEIKAANGGGGAAKTNNTDKAANDAKRLAEEIARQAAAASDALFTEQQRLLVLQQTNPTAKAIVEYTNQELAIQRELNKGLKEAKGEKEKTDLREVARLKSSSNLLDLQNSLNDAGKEGLERLETAIKAQQEELFVNGEIEKLLREKVSPERAKQIADTRLLVNKQLESLDLSIGQAEAAVEEAKARGASVAAIENTIAALKQRRSEIVGKGVQLEAGIPMEGGPKTARDYLMESADEARKNLEQLTNQGYQLAQAANSIGDAFGNAFKGLITGSMTAQEALTGFFSSIADHFADMVAKMIAEWLKAQLIQGFMNFISAIIPGPGALGSAAAGLSGTGALASGGIKGFPGGSMAGLPTSYGASTSGLGSITAGGMGGGFGSWTGPRFANGGIVTGPTMGLVGEGRYNEAIVPLPDGRSIPVELNGGMGGVNVVVNVDATGSEAAGNEGQAKALGSAISAAVQSEIIKQKRPGGLLAR